MTLENGGIAEVRHWLHSSKIFFQAHDSMRTSIPSAMPTVITTIALTVFVAGIAGMLVSFSFLDSTHELDVLAGSAGFLAGALLTTGALVALATISASPHRHAVIFLALRTSTLALAPLAALLAWPFVYFAFFLPGLVMMPPVLLICVVGAWYTSQFFTVDLPPACAKRQRPIRLSLFVAQVILILASLPAFYLLLALLEFFGYKVGWS